MKIALLNTKVKIPKHTTSIDIIGNHKSVWEDFYTCHATVIGENGKELSSAGIVTDDSDLTLSVRYSRKLSEITTTEYRVEFNSEPYNITSIDHMAYKHNSLKIKCTRVRLTR